MSSGGTKKDPPAVGADWGSVELGDVNGERRARFQVNLVEKNKDDDGNETDRLCDGEEDYDEDDDHHGAYVKSFRHMTREALPRLDNYRNIMSIQAAYRPTLDELHNATLHHSNKGPGQASNGVHPGGSPDGGVVKFGWIKGVFIRNLLNIWGVMLFLRLSWVIGQSGVYDGCVIILASSVVTLITALSMSAISTNGVIKGGGTYFMISRSLGPEFGASIGLIFALANAVACAMNAVGFSESLLDLLKKNGVTLVDGGIQDVRIVGVITIFLLVCIVVVGMEWEAKTQMGLLAILLVAISDFFIGGIIGPTDENKRAQGFVGFNATVFATNWKPDYREYQGTKHDFFSVFAIFFPAASGFNAGANISGDLRDPGKAIPKGTILAIVVSTLLYVGMAAMIGALVVRDASGDVTEYLAGIAYNCSGRDCQYGLQNTVQVIELVSPFGLLIYFGCFAATLSSALACLVSAPKVFQALCKDNLYPYISWFGKGYGKNDEPVRGYILTFFIALGFILVGQLNAIAPLISNFFLAAYALMNFSTFHASLIKPVGWRPTFKYYNMWLSLVGAILCVGVMFLISSWTALITLAVVLALYLIVSYRKPDVNWGSTTQAQTYKTALTAVQQLSRVEDHVKNYRPQVLVFSGLPSSRPALVDFAYLITKNISLLVCGHVVSARVNNRTRTALRHKAHSWLHCHKVKAFYSEVDDVSLEEGGKALLQATGLGKLRPNVVLLGYKADWAQCDRLQLAHYFHLVHKSLDLYMAVAILRVPGGLDHSKQMSDEPEILALDEGNTSILNTRQNSQESIPRNVSYSQMSQVAMHHSMRSIYDPAQQTFVSDVSELTPPSTPNVSRSRKVNVRPDADSDQKKKDVKGDRNSRQSRGSVYKSIGGTELPKEVLHSITQFQRKRKKGHIDVWWLYDDGGLTLLLPYLIQTRSEWSNCKLRVFTLANKKDELQFEQRNMASLLAKFRIDYSDLKLIPDITKKPQEETTLFFENLIKDLKAPENDEEGKEEDQGYITEADLMATKDKTNRHLRLRELLLENSTDAELVVMTLPMPRKSVVPAALYMAWLELLTHDMPPFLLVRGNQQSVLTFYS
ncbi:bumetanide-sensitive sodium-(potassium)-chloride cotransporter-like isoform X3 [Nilaparvata lugens]|uniref:bumetanide-sensitive sodium-(potassium)-chloride cotransporter-like isoform X3 n=2 Tax=Nilaparvata lugens TaxID=108931 RepID=UPI00193E75A1|nr:bumetanide-sensitive sodium-(potassium)-chloride cotransporter-like isoform X3 [Nilaparvata lugens]